MQKSRTATCWLVARHALCLEAHGLVSLRQTTHWHAELCTGHVHQGPGVKGMAQHTTVASLEYVHTRITVGVHQQ